MKRKHKIIKNNRIVTENDFLLDLLERTLDVYLKTQDTEYLINTLKFIIEDLKDYDSK